MNWIGRLITLIDLLLFEARNLSNNAWRHVRVPFWVYVAVIAVLIIGTLVGLGLVLVGTISQSDWTIFLGGIVLLAGIALLGVVLVPVAIIVNFFRRRSSAATTTVHQTTVAAPAVAAPPHGGHP